jgi:uncharacterized protein YndB with AHSA1/START domain
MLAVTITQKFEQQVKAPPSQVFKLFTNATRLSNWLSNGATVSPRSGGRLILWWNDGSSAAGEYDQLEKDHLVSFTLSGHKQTAPTQVTVEIQEEEGSSKVAVEEAGPGFGVLWGEALENLVSVLETGLDLRLTMRPMLGITISDFNETIAAQLGVPVPSGIRIDGVVEEMGAKAAGIQKDDVLVSLGGKEANGWETLQTALQDFKAGDRVEVGFYRGGQYKTVNMELSKRKIPEIPVNKAELAENFWRKFEEALEELKRYLEGVSEEEASYKPAEDEWSAKEVLAHIIIGEREFNGWINDHISEYVRWSDDWGGNLHERTSALVAVYTTLPELLDQLRRAGKENREFVSRLPAAAVENQSIYRAIGSFILQSPSHISEHLEQIQKTVQAARG